MLLGVETLKPAEAVAWGTIGMVIDYRLRYYFGAAPWASLVASMGHMASNGYLLERMGGAELSEELANLGIDVSSSS